MIGQNWSDASQILGVETQGRPSLPEFTKELGQTRIWQNRLNVLNSLLSLPFP